MSDQPRVVALDYDGVLADTNAAKAEWIRSHLGVDVDPLRCNRTQCIPLIGKDAYESLGSAVYGPEMTLAAQPVPGMAAALEQLSSQWTLTVVTARPPAQVEAARDWLKKHGVSKHLNGISSIESSAKVDVAKSLGAFSLVDDDPRHLLVPRHPDLLRLLFRSPLEAPDASKVSVIAVASWADVVRTLMRTEPPTTAST